MSTVWSHVRPEPCAASACIELKDSNSLVQCCPRQGVCQSKKLLIRKKIKEAPKLLAMTEKLTLPSYQDTHSSKNVRHKMKFHEFSDRIVFHFWGIFHDPMILVASLTSSSRQVAARRDARPDWATKHQKLSNSWNKGGSWNVAT